MMEDIEKLLKDTFGESFGRLTQFQQEQLSRITSRVQDMAREAVKEDLGKLTRDVADLRARVAALEEERVASASEGIEPTI